MPEIPVEDEPVEVSPPPEPVKEPVTLDTKVAEPDTKLIPEALAVEDEPVEDADTIEYKAEEVQPQQEVKPEPEPIPEPEKPKPKQVPSKPAGYRAVASEVQRYRFPLMLFSDQGGTAGVVLVYENYSGASFKQATKKIGDRLEKLADKIGLSNMVFYTCHDMIVNSFELRNKGVFEGFVGQRLKGFAKFNISSGTELGQLVTKLQEAVQTKDLTQANFFGAEGTDPEVLALLEHVKR